MRTILLLLFSAVLLLVIACSDDDCVTCTEPDQPEPLTYSVIGYWEAITCEGMYLADEGQAHSLTLRRNGSYLEIDSAYTTTSSSGEYEVADGSILLYPDDIPNCEVVWLCQVSADTMIWCRCANATAPTWVFVRSTVY